MIGSAGAIAQALFHFTGSACVYSRLARVQGALSVIGVDGLEPAVPLVLLGGHGGIVTPAPVTVFTRAVGVRQPDKFFLMIRQPPRSTLFPFIALFRSVGAKPLDDLACFI